MPFGEICGFKASTFFCNLVWVSSPQAVSVHGFALSANSRPMPLLCAAPCLTILFTGMQTATDRESRPKPSVCHVSRPTCSSAAQPQRNRDSSGPQWYPSSGSSIACLRRSGACWSQIVCFRAAALQITRGAQAVLAEFCNLVLVLVTKPLRLPDTDTSVAQFRLLMIPRFTGSNLTEKKCRRMSGLFGDGFKNRATKIEYRKAN